MSRLHVLLRRFMAAALQSHEKRARAVTFGHASALYSVWRVLPTRHGQISRRDNGVRQVRAGEPDSRANGATALRAASSVRAHRLPRRPAKRAAQTTRSSRPLFVGRRHSGSRVPFSMIRTLGALSHERSADRAATARRRNLIAISIACFLASVGMMVVMPSLPGLLREVSGGDTDARRPLARPRHQHRTAHDRADRAALGLDRRAVRAQRHDGAVAHRDRRRRGTDVRRPARRSTSSHCGL